MRKFLRIFFFYLYLSLHLGATKLLAEGSFELQPTPASTGYMHLSKQANFNLFGIYGALDENKIKLKIADTTETIYFGFNPQAQGTNTFVPNMGYRIVSPSGVVVFQSTLVQNGLGYIENYNQTAVGPKQVDSTGYDAIQINPKEIGDYVIEFDPNTFGNTPINLKYFDATVINATNDIVKGRLHSQAWQISTNSGSNALNSTVYPYGENGVVYAVDFQGMQPYTFTIKFNSTGATSTGNFLIDRPSRLGNTAKAEFDVFLNPPDSLLYPTLENQFSFEGTSLLNNCFGRDFCLNFTSNAAGTLEGYIDVNGNQSFSVAEGDVLFTQLFDTAKTECVMWDGNKADGTPANLNTTKIYSSFGYGVTHLPLFDVEHNRNGFKVSIVRPNNVPSPPIFWDDTRPGIGGSPIDGLRNLVGCNSQNIGCHLWQDRGNNSNPETINTWWFSELLYDTIDFVPSINLPVQNTFDNTLLDKDPRYFCPGQAVEVFIHTDGEHVNQNKYKYTWIVQGNRIDSIHSQLSPILFDSTTFVTESILLSDTTCVSYDTIVAFPIDSVKIFSKSNNAFCGNGGRIEIELISGTPSVGFLWSNGSTLDTLLDLSPGKYSVRIEDSEFPSCGLDTNFFIVDTVDFGIEKLTIDSLKCYDPDGKAEIRMRNKNYIYEYSWNNSSFLMGDSIRNNLDDGIYIISVQIKDHNCVLDTSFTLLPITNLPVQLSFDPNILDKGVKTVCPGDTVEFYIFNDGQDHPQEAKYIYDWFTKEGIKTGGQTYSTRINENYSLQISSKFRFDFTCISKDTLVVLVTNPVKLKGTAKNAFCKDNGSINLQILSSPPNSNIFWTPDLGMELNHADLKPGSYSVKVIDLEFPKCGADTTFIISDSSNFAIQSFNSSQSQCFYPNGKANVVMQEPLYTYNFFWDSKSGADNISNLPVGPHQLIVELNGSPDCKDTVDFIVTGKDLFLDFETKNDLCIQNKGSISIQNPSNSLIVQWKDGSTAGLDRNNLGKGFYAFTLINPNDISCKIDTFGFIGDSTYTLSPQIIVEEKPEYRAFEPINFYSFVDGNIKSYAWSVDKTDFFSTKDIEYVFEEKNDYEVFLNVIDKNGCKGETFLVQTIIDPVPCGLAMANAFTPNSDGINDQLHLLGYAKTVELLIFNRWGETIYRTFDLSDSWDGTFKSGEAPVGTYPYILKWTCPRKGGAEFSEFRGEITLIR